MVAPTITQCHTLPSCAQSKGDPLLKHEKPVQAVLWTPNDQHIVSCGADDYMCVWQPSTGRFLNTLDTSGPASSAACGHKTSTVAVATHAGQSEGYKIELWDISAEKELKSLVP